MSAPVWKTIPTRQMDSAPAFGMYTVGGTVTAANPDGDDHMFTSWLYGCRSREAALRRGHGLYGRQPGRFEIYRLTVDEADLDDDWVRAGGRNYVRFKRCTVEAVELVP